MKIFGQKIKIIEKDLKGEEFDGRFCHEAQSITIHNNLKDDAYLLTLIHEAGHAMFHRAGLHEAISSELEEVIVEQFAKMMMENFYIEFE